MRWSSKLESDMVKDVWNMFIATEAKQFSVQVSVPERTPCEKIQPKSERQAPRPKTLGNRQIRRQDQPLAESNQKTHFLECLKLRGFRRWVVKPIALVRIRPG